MIKMELYITSIFIKAKERDSIYASFNNIITTNLKDAIIFARKDLETFIENDNEIAEEILEDIQLLNESYDYTIEIKAYNTEMINNCINDDERSINSIGAKIIKETYNKTHSLLRSFIMVSPVIIEYRYDSNIAYCTWENMLQFDYDIMLDDNYNEIDPFRYNHNIGEIIQYNNSIMKIIGISEYSIDNMINYDLSHSMIHTYFMHGICPNSYNYHYSIINSYDDLIHEDDIKEISDKYKWLIPFVEYIDDIVKRSSDNKQIEDIYYYWLSTGKINFDYNSPIEYGY